MSLPFDYVCSPFKAGKTRVWIWSVGKAPSGASVAQIWHINVAPSLLQILAVDLPRATAWKTLQGSELGVMCGAGGNIVSIHNRPQPPTLKGIFIFPSRDSKLFSLAAFGGSSRKLFQCTYTLEVGCTISIDQTGHLSKKCNKNVHCSFSCQ